MTNPTFVDSDPAVILAEIISDFQNLTGRTIYPGQPEYSICSCLAYHKSLAMSRINASGIAVLVDFATEPVLDYLAAPFNITRLQAQSAVCTLRFTLIEGHSEVILPKGTRVISTDGLVIFETAEDATIPDTDDYKDVQAICQTTGESGNGYNNGGISVLQDIYAYITEVSNIDTTSGGSEIESDILLRERLKLATSKFSVAGSTNAYIYWAKTASSLIVDVAVSTFSDFMPVESYPAWETGTAYVVGDKVMSSGILFACTKALTSTIDPMLDTANWITPGQIDIYALLKDGEIPNESLNASIETVLSAENIRPITDNVIVKSAVEAGYDLEVDLVKYPNEDGDALITQVEAILTQYGSDKKQRLGYDIIASEIEVLCRIAGIYDVTVTVVPTTGTLTGRNLEVSAWEVAKLGEITVTITGSNNG